MHSPPIQAHRRACTDPTDKPNPQPTSTEVAGGSVNQMKFCFLTTTWDYLLEVFVVVVVPDASLSLDRLELS